LQNSSAVEIVCASSAAAATASPAAVSVKVKKGRTRKSILSNSQLSTPLLDPISLLPELLTTASPLPTSASLPAAADTQDEDLGALLQPVSLVASDIPVQRPSKTGKTRAIQTAGNGVASSSAVIVLDSAETTATKRKIRRSAAPVAAKTPSFSKNAPEQLATDDLEHMMGKLTL